MLKFAFLETRQSLHDDFNILTGQVEGFDYSNPKICHGGGKGGGGTNTVTNNSAPPPDVTAAYDKALGLAGSAAAAPLQQYSGNTVAPFNDTQNSAFGTIGNASGAATPFINQAQNLIQQGTQPLWSGVQQFSPSAVQSYMSPYTSQVYNAQVAQEGNTNAQQQAALQGNAISKGAWGGDRAGVASAILSGQQDLANNATNANILQQGYNTGLQEFNTQQQAQLGANEANSYLNQQGAFGLANLGNQAFSTQLSGAEANLQAGNQQQQQTQSQLNVPYQQFLQQQAYPFQTAQYYANIAEGIGGNSGGTGTSASTSPAPSTASQVGGSLLGAGALGYLGYLALSDRRMKEDIHRIGGFGGKYPLYRFKYKGSDAPQIGVMAQDVEKKNPGAVHEINGVKHVDYAKLARGGVAGGFGAGGMANSDIPDLSVSYIPTAAAHGGGKGPPQAPQVQAPKTSDPMASGENEMLSALVAGIGASKEGLGGGQSFIDLSNSPGADQMTAMTNKNDVSQFLGPSSASDFAQGMGSFNTTWARGGLVGYDDGGTVGGFSPLTSATAGQQTPTQSSNLNNMTPEQLQQYVMRLPIGSPQSQRATAVLQQKRIMPNVGTTAQGGFGTQQQPQAQQATELARGGFADGGDTSDGIYIDALPPPPNPDQAARALEAQNEIGGSTPVPSAAPGGFGASAPEKQMVASSSPPPSAEDDTPNTRRHSEANPWLALATAGFAAAAGRSPYAMENIGQGAVAGLKDYASQQKEADTTNESVDRLMNEAKQHRATLAQEQQKENDLQNYRTEDLGIKRMAMRQKELIKDQFGNPMGWADPTTGRVIPLNGAPGSASGLSGEASPMPAGSTDPSLGGAPAPSAGDNSFGALPPDAQERLKRVAANPRDQALILGLIQGRISPNRASLGSNPQAYISAASEVDPTFDAATAAERFKTATDYSTAGKSGQQLLSLENTSRHGAATALAALDLNNESSSWNPLRTWINKKENEFEAGRGDPRVGNYNSYLGNYGHEAMKVISGKSNPGEAETAEFMKPMDGSGSPGEILGALAAKNNMLTAVAQNKQEAYENSMGPYGRKKQLVSPEASQAFDDMQLLAKAANEDNLDAPEVAAAKTRLQKWAEPVVGQRKTGTTSPAAVAVPPPAERVVGHGYSTPKGTLFWGADGSWYDDPKATGAP